jgi:putative membrane protein
MQVELKPNKMKATNVKSIVCFFAVIIFAAISCKNDNNTNPKDEAEDRNEAKFTDKSSERDAQFMVDAASAGLMELRMSEHARDRATTQDVKDLANAMITACTAMNAKIKALADSKQITVPTDITSKESDDIADMDKKTGRDYDEEYVDKIMSIHKDAIEDYDKAANQADDPDIRNYFATSLPEMRHQLDMAASSDQKLDAMKDKPLDGK